MATSTIKPKRGTTAQWDASKRILEFNEWGVEETVTGEWVLRVGDGEHEFLELPKVIDTPTLSAMVAEVRSKYDAFLEEAANEYERFEEISADIDAKHAEVIALGGQLQSAYDKSIAAVNSRIDRNDKRITNLERGLPDESFVIDNTVEYAKEVPSNALPYAEIAEIGGMTQRVNVGTEEAPEYVLRSAPVTEVESVGINILCGDVFADKLVEAAGATKDEAAGTVTFSATKISATTLFANFKTDTQYTFIFYGMNTNTEQNSTNLKVEYAEGASLSALRFSNSGADSYCVFVSEAGKSIKRIHGSEQTGSTILHYDKCGIFEGVLTEADFKPYIRNTLPIPEAVRSLDGYGWGINESVYNYVDFEKKQFVKRVERKVFDGTETWTRYSDGDVPYFRFKIGAGKCVVDDTVLSNIYEYNNLSVSNKNIGIDVGASSVANASYIYIRPDDYSTLEAVDFANRCAELAASGTPLTVYYALLEPVITDISDLLPDDNFIGVEGGGTVTMVNEYGYDVPSEVVYQVESEVISE